MSERRTAQPRRGVRVSRARSAVALAIAAYASPGCLESRVDPNAQQDNSCSACHGDPSRPGDALLRSAPPRDLLGASDSSYPGVGAHQIHLQASPSHAAIACSECHVVPKTTDAVGHADSARPAEIVFGALASGQQRSPLYDPASRTCSDTSCHRDAHAVWSDPRSSSDACGTCHGLPPALPHPQSSRCSACHADVIDDAMHFVDPSLHVNGKVEYRFGKCSLCHGTGNDPAPPLDTQGNASTSALGVGAHTAHLTGGDFARPLECTECHDLPNETKPELHVDGEPAAVSLTGVAASGMRTPTWNRTSARCSDSWCHSPEPATSQPSPRWNGATGIACTSCHGMPPAVPHPQLSDCKLCHSGVVGDGNTIVDRLHHVDGVIDVSVPMDCTSCHGSQNPAPPVDLAGSVETSSPGVGAHQTHVLGTARARAVPCNECHEVPNDVMSPGHMDTALPAELAFSGVATAFGATPTYAAGTCSGTPCHGATFPDGNPSGASVSTPTWTRVDGTQSACGACHGLPPPRPHPTQTDCHRCHQHVAADDVSFLLPSLHVDGVVQVDVP